MNQPTDLLAQRLRDLPLAHPDPGIVTARVLAAAAAPARVRFAVSSQRLPVRRHTALAIAALLLAVLPITWTVLYFSPVTAAALAEASGPGSFSSEILRNYGLGSGSGVTAQNSSATASGHEVKLVGAYADPIRTVILLNVTPPAFAAGPVLLSDQFGTTYSLHNAEGNLDTGDQALSFEPASWLASVTGLRFTLSIDRVTLLSSDTVSGAWTVSGTALRKTGKRLQTPAPGPIGTGKAEFVEVRYAGRIVSIRAELRGVSGEGEPQRVGPSGKPASRLNVGLERLGGGSVTPMELQTSSYLGVMKIDAIFNNIDPGTYLVTISLAGIGTLQRTLVVG